MLCSIICVFLTVKKVTVRISKLANTMTMATKRELEVKLDVDGDDEIGDLIRIFNQMMADIRIYVETTRQQERRENEMKFSLLASQVDPHFVCNALNTVNFLAYKKKHEDIILVSTALSNILRDRLKLTENNIYDTVYQEVTVVQNYLKIQEYGYGKNVNVYWKVDERARDCLIPKNVIQPLVENSLIHGLADADTGEISGNIEIEIIEFENKIRIRVEDDGHGMSRERLAEVEQSIQSIAHPDGRGIGIRGIKERLELLYMKEYTLIIESIPEQGTRVVIEIIMFTQDINTAERIPNE